MTKTKAAEIIERIKTLDLGLRVSQMHTQLLDDNGYGIVLKMYTNSRPVLYRSEEKIDAFINSYADMIAYGKHSH